MGTKVRFAALGPWTTYLCMSILVLTLISALTVERRNRRVQRGTTVGVGSPEWPEHVSKAHTNGISTCEE